MKVRGLRIVQGSAVTRLLPLEPLGHSDLREHPELDQGELPCDRLGRCHAQ